MRSIFKNLQVTFWLIPLLLFHCSKDSKNDFLSIFSLTFLGNSTSYSTFVVKGKVLDGDRTPVVNAKVRVVGGSETYSDESGSFDALVSQSLDGNTTQVELEFLQDEEYLGKMTIVVEVEKELGKVRIKSKSVNSNIRMVVGSNLRVENISSTGGAVTKKGEEVAFYYMSGTIKDKNKTPMAATQVDLLPNSTRVETNSAGTYKIPIIQKVVDGKNTIDLFIHRWDVIVQKLKFVVAVDTSTGETSIESQSS